MTDQKYEFTSDWFTNHTILWDAVFESFKPKRILEIGSFEGRSATYIIEKASEYANPLELFCLDTWAGGEELQGLDFASIEARFDKNVKVACEGKQVALVKAKGRSVVSLSTMISKNIRNFDLIYIDGSHLACDALVDAVLSFELLKVGGIMIFDDYNSPNPADDPQFCKLGIDAFMNTYRNKVKRIPFKVDEGDLYEWIKARGADLYQLYIQKVAE